MLLVCGDTFYVYERPIWRIARDNEVLQVIRRDYEDGEDVITSLNSSGMAQLLKVLKTSTVLLVKPTEFNQHRELISLRDGVLDLLMMSSFHRVHGTCSQLFWTFHERN